MGLAGIFILPLYLKYIGAEAYGLVGFYAMLQACFNMLDIGFTPNISRETARFRGGAITLLEYRERLRALQVIAYIFVLFGAVGLLLLTHYFSHSWLKTHVLSVEQVETALQLMVISIALRWISYLYRAVLSGAEQFVWLSYNTIIITTLRYPCALLFLVYISARIEIFFAYQAVVACFELITLAHKTIKDLPKIPLSQHLTKSIVRLFLSIKPILPFTLNITATTFIWILITQTDKFILSRLLPLTEYGYFTLGVICASGIIMLSTPISSVIIPRLTKLKAENRDENFLQFYRQSTRLIAIIVIPTSLILSLFPEQILWLWTNNLSASKNAAPILCLYALGNGALALTAFPYYLQYAYGHMKLHLIGNLFFVSILIPLIIWSTHHYGAIGAGWVWFLSNLIFFIIWTAIVHNHFIKKLHTRWFLMDIFPIFSISTCLLLTLKYWTTSSNNPFILLTKMSIYLVITIIFNLSYIRLSKFKITLNSI